VRVPVLWPWWWSRLQSGPVCGSESGAWNVSTWRGRTWHDHNTSKHEQVVSESRPNPGVANDGNGAVSCRCSAQGRPWVRAGCAIERDPKNYEPSNLLSMLSIYNKFGLCFNEKISLTCLPWPKTWPARAWAQPQVTIVTSSFRRRSGRCVLSVSRNPSARLPSAFVFVASTTGRT
jgi:hypothetical protein